VVVHQNEIFLSGNVRKFSGKKTAASLGKAVGQPTSLEGTPTPDRKV